jgi:hypothetical protein
MTTIEKYEQICWQLAKEFWRKYYYKEPYYTWNCQLQDYPPVGGNPTNVWCFNDTWWDFDNMVTAIKYKAKRKQLDEWYNGTLYEKKQQSLENFLLHGWVEAKKSF